MAALTTQRRFALDTNVLIDLAERKPFALAFLSTNKKHGLAVPPTVIQELAFIAENPSHRAHQLAFSALSKIREWDILPFDLISVGHCITDLDARTLITNGIIPDGEFNDGLIVVEAALAGITRLVTSDNHLLKVNPTALIQALADLDLPPVTIYHPRELMRT